MAARLQAMENGRARSTRGGGPNSATVKKRAKIGTPKKGAKVKAEKKKKVSRATLGSDDDSDIDGSGDEDGEKKEKVKKGGFHKPMVLSATLGEFLGETTVCLRSYKIAIILRANFQSCRGQSALNESGITSRSMTYKIPKIDAILDAMRR
jgi:hypothetical protein